MQKQAPEEELGLSAAALDALKEFAVDTGLLEGLDLCDDGDLRLKVQECMDTTERFNEFQFRFGGGEESEQVDVVLEGINCELGQTLSSTGLTVWRGAEELSRFMWEHRRWFTPSQGQGGLRVVELGAGLGLCGIVAAKLCPRGQVVLTDGGEEFTEEAAAALRLNLERNCGSHLVQGLGQNQADAVLGSGPGPGTGRGADGGELSKVKAQGNPPTLSRAAGIWGAGGGEGGRREMGPAAGQADDTAEAAGAVAKVSVSMERLTWGDHPSFVERHGGGGWDFVLAADVIYLEEQVGPLLDTVVDLLGKPPPKPLQTSAPPPVPAEAATGDTHNHPPPPQPSADAPPRGVAHGVCAGQAGRFLLSFARRNVPVDLVLGEAERRGLQWQVPEGFKPSNADEPVYVMTLAPQASLVS